MTDIKQTDQVYILESIVDRLIASIEELTDDNCFLSDQPVPVTLPGGRYAVTVSMGGGNFPHEYFTGGGIDTLVDDGSVVITAVVATSADRPRRAWKKIGSSEPQAGDAPTLLYFKREVLKALLVDWEPVHEGASILRDMIAPLGYDGPHDVRVGQMAACAMQMRFSTAFDWDLS